MGEAANREVEGPFERALLTIQQLPPHAMTLLHNEVQGPDGFSSVEPRLGKLASALDLDTKTARAILVALSNLYKFLHDATDQPTNDPEEVKAELVELFGQYGSLPDPIDEDLLADRLTPLLINKSAEMSAKVERLKKGFLPNAQTFQSFVDIRPVYSPDRNRILDFVVISQFRILTDKEGESASFVFQVSEDSIGAFKEAVDLLEKKMASVRASNFDKALGVPEGTDK